MAKQKFEEGVLTRDQWRRVGDEVKAMERGVHVIAREAAGLHPDVVAKVGRLAADVTQVKYDLERRMDIQHRDWPERWTVFRGEATEEAKP